MTIQPAIETYLTSASAETFDELQSRLRWLWCSYLPEAVPNREALIVELNELEVAIERLRLRGTARPDLNITDIVSVEGLADIAGRLGELENWWLPTPSAA